MDTTIWRRGLVTGGKWKDFYLLGEVINMPPLLEMGMEEAAWQTAVRDTKRYEVAVVQGKRLVKARYRAPKRKQKQREKAMEGRANRGGERKRANLNRSSREDRRWPLRNSISTM